MTEPLDKARRKYAAALHDLSGGYVDEACEQAYYAARYAALDALDEDDVRGHGEVVRRWLEFCDEHDVEPRTAAALDALRGWRDESLYRRAERTREDASHALTDSRSVIKVVASYLGVDAGLPDVGASDAGEHAEE